MKLCIYCGSEKKISRDHVPPKCLFSKKITKEKNTRFLTVPSCQRCNNDFGKHDDYFRTMLVLNLKSEVNKDASLLGKEILKSLTHENQSGTLKSVLETSKEVELMTPSGLYLGKTGVFKPNFKRLEFVVSRIIKAILYKKYNKIVYKTHSIKSYYFENLVRFSDSDKVKFDLHIKDLMKTERNEIGKDRGVMTYWSQNQGDVFSFLICFYESILFYGFACPNLNWLFENNASVFKL